ncbi:MAG: response regulator [Alphaproteobacteria bacterium]|nr:response regulator [Alphaproteobacteria bacterium]NCQ88531.1 response regulator [Alphaproteobacteria bacterium]NCT06074.1 response regulator [Alphaproteobacteria bacterium]
MTYKLETVKILLVEDMEPMLILTRSILDIFGFKNILVARSGEEAFKICVKENPDLILTDWIMGSMGGMELIEKIRKDPKSPNPYVPIILMTGYTNRARVEHARDEGITEFLAKPYTSKDLYNRIVQIIEKPRQFVRNKEFFGPDRRRRSDADYEGETKRGSDKK